MIELVLDDGCTLEFKDRLLCAPKLGLVPGTIEFLCLFMASLPCRESALAETIKGLILDIEILSTNTVDFETSSAAQVVVGIGHVLTTGQTLTTVGLIVKAPSRIDFILLQVIQVLICSMHR